MWNYTDVNFRQQNNVCAGLLTCSGQRTSATKTNGQNEPEASTAADQKKEMESARTLTAKKSRELCQTSYTADTARPQKKTEMKEHQK